MEVMKRELNVCKYSRRYEKLAKGGKGVEGKKESGGKEERRQKKECGIGKERKGVNSRGYVNSSDKQLERVRKSMVFSC